MTQPPPANPTEAPRGKEPQESAVKALLSVLAAVGVPITVGSALMFYFGWARSDEQARYMGLEVSLFGLTPQDYIMRSINILFMPLIAMGILSLAWLGLHQAIQGWLAVPKLRRPLWIAGRVAFVAGVFIAGVALVTAWTYRQAGPLISPLALATGTAVAGYAMWLAHAAAPPSVRPPLPVGQRALRIFLIAGIITLAMFWELSSYAVVLGRQYADYIAAMVPYMPRATAYSPKPLSIDAPGVLEQKISSDPPIYRTTGLRLLVLSGGRLFLLHEGWKPGPGRVIVLPDSGEVSWQFTR